MQLEEGIKLKGRPVEIPDCSRNDLPSFLNRLGFKEGVEIGVCQGIFTEKLCQAGLKVHGIDPYLSYEDYNTQYRRHGPTQESQDELYEKTKNILSSYDCNLIRKTSMEAVKDFQDESLDFVYIDGHHGFKYIAEDLWEWSKKVKKGGIVSGHDYINLRSGFYDPYTCHVGFVLDAFTKAGRINNWYVLGRKNYVEGEMRDKFRSWFWIKE